MASKFTSVIGRRGLLLVLAVLVAGSLGFGGHLVHVFGLWDGPA